MFWLALIVLVLALAAAALVVLVWPVLLVLGALWLTNRTARRMRGTLPRS